MRHEAVRNDQDKDEVMDHLYWVKQIFALVLGGLAGYSHLAGFPIIIAYVIIISSFSTMYVWQVLKNEEIETWDILSEAFGPSFFLFILTWIISFTYV